MKYYSMSLKKILMKKHNGKFDMCVSILYNSIYEIIYETYRINIWDTKIKVTRRKSKTDKFILSEANVESFCYCILLSN